MKQTPSYCKETHANFRKNTTATFNGATHLQQRGKNWERLGTISSPVSWLLQVKQGEIWENIQHTSFTNKLINIRCQSYYILLIRSMIETSLNISKWCVTPRIIHGHVKCVTRIRGVATKQEEHHGCMARICRQLLKL